MKFIVPINKQEIPAYAAQAVTFTKRETILILFYIICYLQRIKDFMHFLIDQKLCEVFFSVSTLSFVVQRYICFRVCSNGCRQFDEFLYWKFSLSLWFLHFLMFLC